MVMNKNYSVKWIKPYDLRDLLDNDIWEHALRDCQAFLLRKILKAFSKETLYFRMPPLSRAVIETLVKEHRVVLFSKTWCPFCNKVKELFNSKFIPYHRIELDKEPTQISCILHTRFTLTAGFEPTLWNSYLDSVVSKNRY